MTQPKQKPPVPPQNRSPKGTGADPDSKVDTPAAEPPENAGQTGQQGNTRQNTTAGGGREQKKAAP